MKRLAIAAVLAAGLFPATSFAQGTCSNTLTATALTSLFAAKTCVCGAPGASRPNLKWNETHSGGATGTISELALNNPPSEGSVVGNYLIGGNNNSGSGDHGRIVYNYAGGGSFTWVVDDSPVGNTYRFCSVGAHTTNFLVNIKPGGCSTNC